MKSIESSKQEARRRAGAVWADFLASDGPGALLRHLDEFLEEFLRPDSRILITLPLQDEIDLVPNAVSRRLPTFAPVTLAGGRMEFRLLFDSGAQVAPSEPGHGGVPGPSRRSELLVLPMTEADLVVVPSRAANPLGYRLGRGGGYYDRWQRALEPACKIAALPSDLARLQFSEDGHDLRLDFAITEDGALDY